MLRTWFVNSEMAAQMARMRLPFALFACYRLDMANLLLSLLLIAAPSIAWANAPAVNAVAPTLGEAAFLSLSLLLPGAGVWYIRRRRARS